MFRLPAHRWLACAVWATLSLGAVPRVHAQSIESISRELTDIEGDASAVTRDPLQRRALRSATHVEERLTDGELFYQLHDYVRASIIFTDIVDNYQRHRAYPNALYLLADSLFRAGDYLGARTRFRQVIQRADEQAFRPYVQLSLGRLIEIAIHTRNFDGVEDYFARLSRLPPTEIAAATTYFRAKFLYNRAVPTEEMLRESAQHGSAGQQTAPVATPQINMADLDAARQAFEAVPERSPYYAQSRYFVGVIFTIRGQYPQAIEAFRRVLRAPATTEEQRSVIDLTQLALGRLYYETDQLDQASEAYQSVPRTSPNFDVALYEIAWVYIRQGDATRAERALEVLTVAAPDSRFIPDGKILRGNLLLRNGRFDDANRVFREVAAQFGPVRRELDELMASHEDPEGYFRDLVRQNLDSFDANAFLPPLAVQWTQTEGDMDRALRVLSDLGQARTLVRETSQLIERLNAALNSPNRVNIFPDLRGHRERTVALRNRLARLRGKLLALEERVVESSGNPELATVRTRRREIERLLGGMPAREEDFAVRNDRLLNRYSEMNRELSDLEVQLLGMDARIVATDRFLTDTADRQNVDASGLASVRNELATHREAAVRYREEISQLHMMIEAGRVQVGVGDARYQRDDRLRDEYNGLVARERELIASSGSPEAQRTDNLFRRASAVEERLNTHDTAVDAVVEERTADMRRVLAEETTNVEGYRERLGVLETETIDVVGAVTHANFRAVRDRFYDLVLRADVGRIDVSWAIREEHRMRVEMLTRERARDIQALDDEFREIMDEGATTEPEAPAPQGGQP